MACEIRIGCSGWHYKHWIGRFYPAKTPPSKMLEFYFQHFDTVELNNSFYKLPDPKNFECWRNATPSDFRFAVKASRFLTHNKKLKEPENALEKFLPRAEVLGDKLGPVLFQLPPHWRINLQRLEAFLTVLPRGHRYTFEFREPTWNTPETYALLRRFNAAYCVFQLAGSHSPIEVTADFAYVRLHGPTEKKYQGSYTSHALRQWAERIREWSRELKAVYVYFDNDDSAFAAQDALALKRWLAEPQIGASTEAAPVGTHASTFTEINPMPRKANSAQKTSPRAGYKTAKVHEMPRRTAPKGSLKQPKAPYPAQHQRKPGLESEMKLKPKYFGEHYRPAGKLEDKCALITGADSGIGRSVAVLYAREGALVAIVYLPQEQSDAEETRDVIEGVGGECLLIPGDITDPRFCKKAVEKTVKEFGRLDILVNNAAYQQHQEKVEELSDEQWDHTFKTNIYGYFRMVKAALPHLREGSTIINTGSITGLQGNKQLLDYSSTKGAIHAFTKSLAQMLVERKIRVNCVSPGPVWTPLNVADKPAEKVAEHGKKTPMERAAQPEEIAPAYVFFASEADSSYITGEVLTLLGGETTAA